MARHQRKPDPAYRTPGQRRLSILKWTIVLAAAAYMVYRLWTELGRT